MHLLNPTSSLKEKRASGGSWQELITLLQREFGTKFFHSLTLELINNVFGIYLKTTWLSSFYCTNCSGFARNLSLGFAYHLSDFIWDIFNIPYGYQIFIVRIVRLLLVWFHRNNINFIHLRIRGIPSRPVIWYYIERSKYCLNLTAQQAYLPFGSFRLFNHNRL